MQIAKDNALNLIKQYDTIIIHRHTFPDGDAVGSQVGLKHIILHNFPHKKVYIVGDDARRYAFMDDSKTDIIDDDAYKGALAIVLDCSAKSLISDNRYTLADKTIRIDHHLFCEDIADVDIDDTSFESCCGLIASLALEWGLHINQIAGKSLYTGMVTDSGRFRYDSTTPRTMRIASTLLETGFDATSVYNKLYEDDFEMIKLRASFVLSVQFTKHKVAYIYTTLDRLKELGVDANAISRGMVNTMAEIRGVDVWANFTETENGVLCELRSKTSNINQIAVKYGGGGHIKASGATVANRQIAMQMLADLDNIVANNQQ